jgi:hypothetical protein
VGDDFGFEAAGKTPSQKKNQEKNQEETKKKKRALFMG